MSRSTCGSRPGSSPASGSSGPASSADPRTATHSQPARNTRVARGSRRRFASFAVAPRATKASVVAPLTGCGSTPALTTLTDGCPSERTVTSTASHRSAAPYARTSRSPSSTGTPIRMTPRCAARRRCAAARPSWYSRLLPSATYRTEVRFLGMKIRTLVRLCQRHPDYSPSMDDLTGTSRRDLPLLSGGVVRERADAARNRLKVLAAAERLFAAQGVGAVSMDEVATVAGVGKGTLYRRFGDKSGLAAALLDEREAEL